jgi:hypothetical protein
MCNCNESRYGLLADKLRFHHNERNRLLKELNNLGFKVFVRLESNGVEAMTGPGEITKIEKIEKISL